MKNPPNIFGFLDICVRIGSQKFFVRLQEHLPSAVNMLTNSHTIYDLTKRHVFQLN